MVILDNPWLCAALTSLALAAASCGDEAPPDEELIEEDEDATTPEEEEAGPDPVEACVGTADALVHLGSSDHDGSMDGLQHLAALDDVVYGCAQNTGIALWDVSNLAAPKILRGDPRGTTATCNGLAVDQVSRTMAVARAEEIELYSVEDPTTPTLLSTHPRAGAVDLTFGTDGRLYAAAEQSGVYAYGLESGQLVEQARFSDAQSDARAVASVGSTLTVAEGRTGVRVYTMTGDALVASAPVAVTGTAVEVEMQGATAYVATLEGIAQIDTADPASPRMMGLTQSPGTAMAMTVTDQALWVSDWTALRAFDLNTLAYAADETLVNDIPTLLDRTATVIEDEGRVFVAHWTGLRTYAPCTPNAPSLWPEVGRMEFNNIVVNEPKTRVLTLRNLGNQPLRVNALSTDHSMFTVDEAGFDIPAGGATPIEITFTPTNESPAQGNLIISSNDPDEPDRQISISGNIPRAVLGSKVEPFHDVDTNGQAWRPKDLEGKVAVLAYFAFW